MSTTPVDQSTAWPASSAERQQPRRWIVACAVAEAIGMTAAAAAARAATDLDEAGVALAWSFLVVVVGGLVEGTALGALQARALPLPHHHGVARRWLFATIAVAGVGWALGSAPATLAGDDAGATPSVGIVVLSSALLGAGMGGLLGVAQAWAVRGAVRHPWRWVTGSAAGWAAAMPVVFLGATVPGPGWSVPAVIGLGTATGLGAGAVLGAVTTPYLRALDGPPVRHRMVLAVLASPVRGLVGPHLVGLAVRGHRTGRVYRFPVMAAAHGSRLVVLPGAAERKTWWRNIATVTDVRLLRDGSWKPATASLARPGTREWNDARIAYEHAFHRTAVGVELPLVVVEPVQPVEPEMP